MAEALLKAALPKEHLARYEIHSAGTHTANGLPASDHTLTVMNELGIDLGSHRSQPATEVMIEKADLILALSTTHLEHIQDRFPESAGRTYLLTEYADKSARGQSIADPVGGTLDFYRATRDEIKRRVEQIARKM